MAMRAAELIEKKRNGESLSTEEIDFLIQGYTAGTIPDYQMAAFLMALWFRGMDGRETTDLTMSMMRSGDIIDLSSIPGIKVDKHSTGGVADTTTLVAAPLVAACGGRVAKMSGRGLGHTGGTLDKLESIPGFTVEQSMERFAEIVGEHGLSVIGQSADLVPADKKLYSLRDVTATIDNISLIASSIMSKKLAAGSDAIVLDVKTGSGAFMKAESDAVELARAMVAIGRGAGKTGHRRCQRHEPAPGQRGGQRPRGAGGGGDSAGTPFQRRSGAGLDDPRRAYAGRLGGSADSTRRKSGSSGRWPTEAALQPSGE